VELQEAYRNLQASNVAVFAISYDSVDLLAEAGLSYACYFATERGRRGLTAYRRDIARVICTRNSPRW
jgi:hypothetical protein